MRPSTLLVFPLVALGALAKPAQAQQATAKPSALILEVEKRIPSIMPKVIAWRRDLHEHPELSGEEVRTAGIVANHLKSLGLEVRTEVGGHGVIGVLKGGKPGPVVALRADMDGLPVAELVDLPFKSTATGTYRGQTVGIMHACGHDTHVSMLMGVAEILAGMKAQIPGTVKFIFQPAEEGLPNGGTGAKLVIADGALENPKVDAIFGLHVGNAPLGQITYRPGPAMAASNAFTIVVNGKQSHGAMPWAGVDPIVIGSQIVGALQTVISRQIDISGVPAIITVGAFNGGVRNNIVPDSVVMVGTIRTFDMGIRKDVFERINRIATQIASASGAKARVVIDSGNIVTRNDSTLTLSMVPTLARAAGSAGAVTAALWTASEDFSWYQDRVPGLFFNLGVTPNDRDWRTAPSNHSPYFFADEAALPTGVRAMASVAVDYLLLNSSKK